MQPPSARVDALLKKSSKLSEKERERERESWKRNREKARQSRRKMAHGEKKGSTIEIIIASMCERKKLIHYFYKLSNS